MVLKRWYGSIKFGNPSVIFGDIKLGMIGESKKLIASLMPPLTYEKFISIYKLFG
jgi:hypothetical protein